MNVVMSEDVDLDGQNGWRRIGLQLDSAPVLHVLVVGFHHQRGAEVQFVYPDFITTKLEKGLPVPWKSLLYLALPDGAHNFEEDFIFFKLPCLQEYKSTRSGNVFCVACFQQIAAKELKVKEDDITRTTVQKSVVIILRMPLYGFVLSKLLLVTKAYFNEKDFSKTDILKDTYLGLSNSLSSMKPNNATFHMGLREVALELKDKILILLKLLLLERKVVFWGCPVGKVCKTVLSLISLFPESFNADMEQTGSNSDMPNIGAVKDQYGLPLDIFGEEYIFHPYLSLQQMDELKSKNVKGYVVGTSNVLYKHQNHCQWDVLVDLKSFELIVPDSSLSNQISLTTEDLRFTEFINSTVSEYDTDSEIDWDGSDDWIRIQFKYYILCLLASVAPEKGSSNHIYKQFNDEFIMAWKQTNNFNRWSRTLHSGLDTIHQGHPFEGGLTISDVKLRIQSRIGDTLMSNESREKIGAAIQRTGQAVGSALNSAKTTLSSWKGWFTGLVQEINDEMRMTSTNVEFVNSNEREVNATSEELSHGMTISNRERIGRS